MDLNLGKYLRIMFPKRIIGKGVGEFLNDFFVPIIDDFNILNKDNDPYVITKEFTSRILNNLINVPNVLIETYKKSINKEQKYIKIFEKTFRKFFTNEVFIYEKSEEIFKEFAKLKVPNDKLKELSNFLEGNNYALFHWHILKNLIMIPNKNPSLSLRSVGRPKKDNILKDFFYLSEEEKHKEFIRLVKTFSNEDIKVTKKQFIYFLDSINYINCHVEKRIKIKILRNFYNNLEEEKGITKVSSLKMYFDDDAETQGRIDKYNEWIEVIPEAAVQEEIKNLKNNLEFGKENGNYDLLRKQFEKDLRDKIFVNNSAFKQELINNNFFLPEFTGSIDRNLWTACHQIADYITSINLTNDFINLMNSIKDKNPNNLTIQDRCDGLIDRCKRTLRGYSFSL